MENNEYQNQATETSALAPAPKKDSKTGLYVIIAILATLVVGLAVVLVIVLVSGGKGGEASGSTESGGSEKDSLIMKRDEERRERLSVFLEAAATYQTNNNGKIPWSYGRTDKKFVQRYIDMKCTRTTADVYSPAGRVEEDEYKCETGAEDWLDPDGNVYGFKVINSIERGLTDNGTNDVSIREYLGKWPNGYKIVVVPNSSCSKESGTVTWHNAPRQFSLLMRLEGGDIACVDNH